MLGAGDYINIGHYASPRAFAALCNVQSGREGNRMRMEEEGGRVESPSSPQSRSTGQLGNNERSCMRLI